MRLRIMQDDRCCVPSTGFREDYNPARQRLGRVLMDAIERLRLDYLRVLGCHINRARRAGSPALHVQALQSVSHVPSAWYNLASRAIQTFRNQCTGVAPWSMDRGCKYQAAVLESWDHRCYKSTSKIVRSILSRRGFYSSHYQRDVPLSSTGELKV